MLFPSVRSGWERPFPLPSLWVLPHSLQRARGWDWRAPTRLLAEAILSQVWGQPSCPAVLWSSSNVLVPLPAWDAAALGGAQRRQG